MRFVKRVSYAVFLDRLAQSQMKEFMEDDPEALALIRDVVRKEVHLPVARPACWHNPRRHTDTGLGGIPDYLKLDYRTYPQIVKDFFRKFVAKVT